MDPAWFYSALAQASAAIVGLTGAILGSQLIRHAQVVEDQQHNIKARLAYIRNRIHDRIASLDSFEAYLRRTIADSERHVAKGETSKIENDYKFWFGGGSQHTIEDLKAHLDNAIRDQALLAEVRPVYQPLKGSVSPVAMREFASNLIAAAPTLPDPHRTMKDDAEVLSEIAQEFQRFLALRVPTGFVVILAALALITVGGIFWPLWILPGTTGSHDKLGMMLFLTAGIAALVVFFIVQLRILWKMGDLSWDEV